MKPIASCVVRAPLTFPGAAVVDVAARFASLPDVRALAVGDDGRIVGLVYREAVDTASRYSRAGQTVKDLMTVNPLVMPSTLGLREAMQTLLDDRQRREAFVVMDDGCYVGVSGLRSLTTALMESEWNAEAVDRRIAAAVMEDVQKLVRAAQSEYRGHVEGLLAMSDRLGRQHLPPDAQTQLRSINATGQSLLRLADDALDMLKAREGRLELQPRPLLLREVADRVQERWSERAAEAGVGLLTAYDGDPDLTAMVDAARLMQVFDNLIDNALRHTRQGSIEVSLRARETGDRVTVEGRVRDTGPGLTAAKLARIFDLGDGPDGQGGSLPLSLTRGILLSMKGSIRAESNVGQGMTIVFDMMATKAQPVAPLQTRPDAVAAPHVLVVDDNATNRMVAEALCEMFGCTCETATDGVEALDAARSGRFDMILMDIKMPRMDGIAATRAIRALDGAAGAAPIVALTANVDPEDARAYLAAGMCGVVEKPIKPERLLQAINMALTPPNGGAQSRRAVAAA